VNRVLVTLLASFVVGSVLGESTEPIKIRITTWNLEWFPNGSAHDATPEVQAQRIAAAADVIRPINPDIVLLQEVRDYDAVLSSVKRSRQEFIKSQFALRLGNHSKVDWVNSKSRSYPNIKRKPRGQNRGNP
jgi:endonuclease/exonuclease/phosphatase family metal-dependent hydrolase